MPRVVISDTSVLIVFSKIEKFDLLKEVYTEVYTTPEIIEEFGEDIPAWIIVEKVKPIINKLMENDFRISDAVLSEILRLNDEEA